MRPSSFREPCSIIAEVPKEIIELSIGDLNISTPVIVSKPCHLLSPLVIEVTALLWLKARIPLALVILLSVTFLYVPRHCNSISFGPFTLFLPPSRTNFVARKASMLFLHALRSPCNLPFSSMSLHSFEMSISLPITSKTLNRSCPRVAFSFPGMTFPLYREIYFPSITQLLEPVNFPLLSFKILIFAPDVSHLILVEPLSLV